MAAAKTKSRKPAAARGATKTVKASPRPKARPSKKGVGAMLIRVSAAEVHSQVVHLLTFIFACLCLIFLALAYYAYT